MREKKKTLEHEKRLLNEWIRTTSSADWRNTTIFPNTTGNPEVIDFALSTFLYHWAATHKAVD